MTASSRYLVVVVVFADGRKNLPVTALNSRDEARMHALLSTLGNERVRFSPPRAEPPAELPEDRQGSFREAF